MVIKTREERETLETRKNNKTRVQNQSILWLQRWFLFYFVPLSLKCKLKMFCFHEKLSREWEYDLSRFVSFIQQREQWEIQQVDLVENNITVIKTKEEVKTTREVSTHSSNIVCKQLTWTLRWWRQEKTDQTSRIVQDKRKDLHGLNRSIEMHFIIYHEF